MFVYELSGCGFESCCCHINVCFERGVPWQSRDYRVSFTLKCICDMIRTHTFSYFNHGFQAVCDIIYINWWVYIINKIVQGLFIWPLFVCPDCFYWIDNWCFQYFRGTIVTNWLIQSNLSAIPDCQIFSVQIA